MNAVVNELMTNYTKSGRGPTLVFLHGWGDSSQTFARLIELMPQKYQFVGLDLPGFGGTQMAAEAWSLDDFAAFVADWLKKAKIGPVEGFITHSNGGAIAIKGLSSGKFKAKKLVLLASAGVRDQAKIRKKVLSATAKGGKAATLFLPENAKHRLKNSFYKSIGSEATMLPQLEETFRRIVSEDIQGDAAKLKVPTLLIYGESDKQTPLAYGELLAGRIINSRLVPVAKAGHFVHQDQPHQIAELVSDFMVEG